MGVALSKNQYGKLLGHLAVFSLNNIPSKLFNNKTQENPWNTQASITTPTKISTNNTLETTKPVFKKAGSKILISTSIAIIIISITEILEYYRKTKRSSS